MRIQRKTNTKKRAVIILSILAIILLTIGGAVYWYYGSRPSAVATTTDRPANTVDYGPPTQEELKETADQKEQIIQNQENTQKPSDNSTAATDSSITVSVSNASQSKAGEPLNVRAFVDGLTSGTCYIDFTRSGQSKFSVQAPVEFEATSAHCFADVNTALFSQSGDWTMTIYAKKDSKTSATVSQTVTINK